MGVPGSHERGRQTPPHRHSCKANATVGAAASGLMGKTQVLLVAFSEANDVEEESVIEADGTPNILPNQKHML